MRCLRFQRFLKTFQVGPLQSIKPPRGGNCSSTRKTYEPPIKALEEKARRRNCFERRINVEQRSPCTRTRPEPNQSRAHQREYFRKLESGHRGNSKVRATGAQPSSAECAAVFRQPENCLAVTAPGTSRVSAGPAKKKRYSHRDQFCKGQRHIRRKGDCRSWWGPGTGRMDRARPCLLRQKL